VSYFIWQNRLNLSQFLKLKFVFNITATFQMHQRVLVQYATAVEARATSQKVAGSIPDGVTGIFRWHNPSGRTMALGLTQP